MKFQAGSELVDFPSPTAMLKANRLLVAWFFVLSAVGQALATDYVTLGLHARVELSHAIVLGRIVDPARALVTVERKLKGEAPKQITLVAYIDDFKAPAERRPLVQDARELLFLKKDRDGYAPLQKEYGRFAVVGNRLIDGFRVEPRSLSETLASIDRLVTLQTRAARGPIEADDAYVTAFGHADREVQNWALETAARRIKIPSPALADALLKHWPKDGDLVANAVVSWRLRRAAPLVAKTLTTSRDGNQRAWAAMALGGTGDLTYLPLLRRVASADAHSKARAAAYRGIVWILGPNSLDDLRLGAEDAHEEVRRQVVVDAYNLLQLNWPERRWPPASSAVIDEIRAFLAAMQRDPAPRVSKSAKSLLAYIERHHRP